MKIVQRLRRCWNAKPSSSRRLSLEATDAALSETSTTPSNVRSTLPEAPALPSSNMEFTRRPSFDLTLGERAAALVLNHHRWVKRRVESVQFLPEGQTRHHISFDLTIPDRLIILGHEIESSGDDQHVAIPLTYMKKGPLVDLDIIAADGSTLSSVNKEENGRITVAALTWLFENLHSGELAEHKQEAISDFERVVYSRVDSSNGGRNIVSTSSLDEAREKYFKDLLAVHLENRESCAIPKDKPVLHLEFLPSFLSERVHNSPDRSSNQSDTPSKEMSHAQYEFLTVLLMLLSTVSTSYAFTALVPKDAVMSRTIVKISFDTDIPAATRRRGRTRDPRVSPYRIYIPARAAQSTHVDLLPADGTEILGLAARPVATGAPKKILLAKVMGSRIHINLGKLDETPLTLLTLGIWCLRRPLMQATCGAVFASIICGSAFIISLLRPAEVSRFFMLDNVLEALALVFALWLATILDMGRHRLTQDVNEPLSRTIFQLVTTISVSLLSLSLIVDVNGFIDIPGSIFCWNSFRDLISLLPSIVTFACFALCLSITCRTRKWMLERRKDVETLDRIREHSNLEFTNEDDSSLSAADRDTDAAEIAAFECIIELQENVRSKAFASVESVSAPSWKERINER